MDYTTCISETVVMILLAVLPNWNSLALFGPDTGTASTAS